MLPSVRRRKGIRWSEAHLFVEFAQTGQGSAQIEGLVVLGGLTDRLREFEGQAADGFLAVFDDHLVDSRLDGLRGAAEGHRAAGLGLQAQCRVFERVRHRHRVVALHRLEQGNFREAFAQTLFETGNVADRALGFAAVDDGLDGGVPAPQIGAAQGADA
jgi:hypothetical protein